MSEQEILELEDLRIETAKGVKNEGWRMGSLPGPSAVQLCFDRIASLEADLADARKANYADDFNFEHDLRVKLQAEVERLKEAALPSGIDHKVFEMVCEERDALQSALKEAEGALKNAKYHYWNRCYDGKIPGEALTVDQFDAVIDAALAKLREGRG